MVAVVNDTYSFFDILSQRYNIQMFESKRTPQSICYLGEAYTTMGELFVVSIVVRIGTTELKVLRVNGMSKSCVFQKNYSTKTDKFALSKSVSLFNFLDKLMY
jgi:hypothetical protein